MFVTTASINPFMLQHLDTHLSSHIFRLHEAFLSKCSFWEQHNSALPWIVCDIFQVNSDDIMVEKSPFDAQEVQIGVSALAWKL